MEFSKKILIYTFGIAVVIILYAMFIQYLIVIKDYQGGTDVLTTLIGALGVEVASGTGFYYWKAKRENELKLQLENKENYREEDM